MLEYAVQTIKSRHDSKYLWNGWIYPESKYYNVRQRFLPHSAKKVQSISVHWQQSWWV